ncbi:hypothetical protein [Piscinibacter sp.]|uniref:hypothetical protein n=1 Tax=Piscinibacter sp. TaxID=1903157 RepID=UPI002BB3B9C1|nr:hypothetical protein [Albitalea sp.]HUG26092.1 hypothetical protein [Albitalea sp.]
MSTVSMSPLLRRALTADALLSAAAGVLMTLGADWLHGLLNLPVSLFMAAGVAMFPWAGFLLWLTRRAAVPRAAVWTVIAINVLWIIDSAWVAAGGTFEPNALGQAFVAVQALAVLVLVELQFIGLRRSSLAMA